jgi:hypothetical protein
MAFVMIAFILSSDLVNPCKSGPSSPGIVGMAMSAVQSEKSFAPWATIRDSTTGEIPLFAPTVAILALSIPARIRAAGPSTAPNIREAISTARSAALSSNGTDIRFTSLPTEFHRPKIRRHLPAVLPEKRTLGKPRGRLWIVLSGQSPSKPTGPQATRMTAK